MPLEATYCMFEGEVEPVRIVQFIITPNGIEKAVCVRNNGKIFTARIEYLTVRW